MADSNNNLAGKIPTKPYIVLKTLEPLLGKWIVSGGFVEGAVSFEWLDGGYFLVQNIDLKHGNQVIKGLEYIGFDEDTQTLRSHYMDNNGSNFTYTWKVKGKTIQIWFGNKDSDNFFEGKFSKNGNSYSGKWQWPGGGYEATMTRSS
jgi:hypothetical protein